MTEKPTYVVDEPLGEDLRYTESFEENEKGPYRLCAARFSDQTDSVSRLRLFSFDQRFGSTALSVEGVGDVNTHPDHRRKGHLSSVMKRALRGAANRVDAAFLFGISGFYGSFGFTTCLARAQMELWLRNVVDLERDESFTEEKLTIDDLPEILGLFNSANSRRPWTRVRDERLALRLFDKPSWEPALECIAIKRDGRTRAYAVLEGYGFGWMDKTFKTIESAADSRDSALALLLVLRDMCLSRDIDTIKFSEVPDSTFGRTLRLSGATVFLRHQTLGGGMGLLLNRTSVVEKLTAELYTRAAPLELPGGFIDALADGSLIDRQDDLLKLLVGYWSWDDALHEGVQAPEKLHEALRGCFPGGGTQQLLLPTAHGLDDY